MVHRAPTSDLWIPLYVYYILLTSSVLKIWLDKGISIKVLGDITGNSAYDSAWAGPS